MNFKEYYTHEANVSVEDGCMTFPFSASYFGKAVWEDGVEDMLKQLFPAATEIVVRRIE